MSDGWSAFLQTLEGHSSHVSSVAFSHDSTRLASASGDRTVKIWEASSGACLQTLKGHYCQWALYGDMRKWGES
jgi:WD40 repeat protein